MRRYNLIGAGGTGSHFIGSALAYLDSWHRNNGDDWEFYVADGDNFAESNTARQMFDPKYIGSNKADAMAEMYKQYPIISVPKFLGEPELERLISEDSVTVIGVDNVSLRALVQERVNKMYDAVVINGGNEYIDGNAQLWVRKDGENKTPPLSFLQPGIVYQSSDDRSAMTCAQAMELPGGEQLIIANMSVATHLLTLLWKYLNGSWVDGYTKVNFDLETGETVYVNYRKNRGWEKDREITRIGE